MGEKCVSIVITEIDVLSSTPEHEKNEGSFCKMKWLALRQKAFYVWYAIDCVLINQNQILPSSDESVQENIIRA